jgi:2-dehydropantoate 2-reductase
MSQSPPPRLAIYGAGSLGTVIGAFIAKAGVSVDLVNCNAAHVQALRETGAHVTGTVEFTQAVTALTPDEMTGTYDLIFLLTKQQFNREVAEQLRPLLSDDGALVTFQNGIPEPLLAGILGGPRVLGAVVEWGATMTGPGTVRLTSPLDASVFRVGSIGEANSTRLTQTVDLLQLMCSVAIETNFIGVRWTKLLINAAFSGMSTVIGGTFGQAVDDLRSRECVHMVMKECMDVAQAAGVAIESVQGTNPVTIYGFNSTFKKWIANKLLPLAVRKHRDTKASMLQDIEAGKKTEVDSIDGVVCEGGERHGLQSPYSRKIVELVHRREKGELRPALENVALFDDLKQA